MSRWLTVLAMLLVSVTASAEVIFPSGGRVGLEPPSGMTLSDRFSGFENPERMTSISIIELPAIAYEKAIADLAKGELKRQGLQETSRQSFKVDGREVLLVSGIQITDSGRVRKWVAVAGDATTTAFVVVQTPSKHNGYTDAQIIAAIRSVTFRPPLSLEQQTQFLPFTIGDLSGFRIIRVVSGNSVVLTDGPKDSNLDGEQPIVVIGASMGAPPDAANREAFSRQALAATQNLRNIIPERSEAFRLKGDDWYEIVARASDTLSARPVVVMQTIRFRGGGYIRILGMVKAENRTGTLRRFLKLIDSIEFKES